MLTIRAARAGDYPTFARLFPELATGDPVPGPERFDAVLRPTTLLAEEDAAAAGYAYYEFLGDLCYVRNLVTAPDRRRTGVGRALLQRVLVLARESGCSRWCLNVKPDNTAAVRLYESFGLVPAHEGQAIRIEWDRVGGLPGEEVARALDPSEEAGVERAFDLELGLLANRRAKGGVSLAVDRDGAVVAVATFDPQFPGGYPFYASTPEDAGALLRAMRARRATISDGGSWRERGVQIFVERPPALAETLLGLGAERILRILHMRAALPGA